MNTAGRPNGQANGGSPERPSFGNAVSTTPLRSDLADCGSNDGPDRFRAPPCEAIKHYLHRIARQPPQHCAEGKHNQHESQTLTCPRKILNPKNIFQPSPAVLGGGLAGDTPPRVKCLWESFLFLRELFLRRERISQSVCVEL